MASIVGTLARVLVCVVALLGTQPVAAQKVVKIGAPLELSGRFVAYGAQGQRGLEMAIETWGGAVAGHRIEALVRDIQSTNQEIGRAHV